MLNTITTEKIYKQNFTFTNLLQQDTSSEKRNYKDDTKSEFEKMLQKEMSILKNIIN